MADDTYNKLMDCLFMHYFNIEDIKWKEQLEYVENLWHLLSLTPHMGGVRGDHYGWSTYAQSYKGMKRKVEKFNYERIGRLFADVLLPTAIKEKAVNEFVSSISINAGCYENLNAKKHSAYTSFIIEKDKLEFSKAKYIEIARKFHEFTGAKYGYYLRWIFEYHPALYYSGFKAYYSPTEFDEKKLTIWKERGCRPETMHLLRDIYSLNFMAKEYLELPVFGGTLGAWIEAEPEIRGRVTKLADNFYAWDVEDHNIERVYRDLCPTGIIVCAVED